ncbi:relaxin-3-like [Poeciliopsis prolifica]|uniref:relaxin-3-like n=1 Tax=Poeciliopsis prolifica TaxID=188132 RepID=UPI0024135B1F|nr:relaxin-3-like [Poeciliopsis prolifica]
MRSSLQLGVLLCCLLCAADLRAEESRNSMRLCGRALVRALVFTCGGSRWRRQLEEEEEKGFLPDDFWEVNGEESHFVKTGERPGMDQGHRRDQDQALITTCCQQGCRRNELSMLC